MEIATSFFAGLGTEDEGVEEHAYRVTGDYGTDEGLVACGFEGRRFRSEENQLNDGSQGK